MSEYIPTEIHIGGRISWQTAIELIQAIKKEDVSLEYDDTPWKPTSVHDLLAIVKKTPMSLLLLYKEQANWGQLNDLESFLQQHHIPFDRLNDAHNEYPADLLQYRPHGVFYTSLLDSQKKLIHRDPVRAALAELESDHEDVLPKVVRTLRRALGPDVTELPPFHVLPQHHKKASKANA